MIQFCFPFCCYYNFNWHKRYSILQKIENNLAPMIAECLQALNYYQRPQVRLSIWSILVIGTLWGRYDDQTKDLALRDYLTGIHCLGLCLPPKKNWTHIRKILLTMTKFQHFTSINALESLLQCIKQKVEVQELFLLKRWKDVVARKIHNSCCQKNKRRRFCLQIKLINNDTSV